MNTVVFESQAITPSKIVCIGLNYAAHISEMHSAVPTEAVIFIKPNSAISGNLKAGLSDELHFESELSFLVQDGVLAAVGFGLDITNRPLQSQLKQKGLPWERAKAFDGAAVFSPFVAIDGDLSELRLTLRINGNLTQQGGVELMMLKPDELLAEIKTQFTLEDGDIIMTGTPAGVGPYKSGDHFAGQVFLGGKLLTEGEWIAG